MAWKVGDECWSTYCSNTREGLLYVPGLVGQVIRIEGEVLVIRRARPGPKGELLERVHAAGRAWTSREPCEAWCRERVSPYGPSMGRGSMGVAGNGVGGTK